MKKLCLTLEDFFNLDSAVIYNSEKFKPITKVTIDSRSISKGCLFIAIKGEKFDGHDFVADAVKAGAGALVVSQKKFSSLPEIEIPVVAVKDTVHALGELASTWREKLKTKIIGLTGSAGKTTTKEILFALLSRKFNVNKTQANNNNHIGVPLTLFSTSNKHDYLVLEMGTNHFGEIKYSANIAKPNYALITNIGNSHIEFLKDKNGVHREKSALFDAAVNQKGLLFINNDDPYLKKAYRNYSKRVTFGFTSGSQVQGTLADMNKDGKPTVTIKYKNRSSSFSVPLYGEQNAKNFLAASAVALKIGLSFEEIKEGLRRIKSVDKRLNVQLIGNSILINDTYNASPESMKMSLQLMGRMKTDKKRIAVLGDMFELGEKSKALHEELCDEIVKNSVNEIYTIGIMMKHLNRKLKRYKTKAVHFSTREDLNNFLKNNPFPNSIVLVKGSRGMRMEEFVETIKSKLNSKV